jgi:hypothetical protein
MQHQQDVKTVTLSYFETHLFILKQCFILIYLIIHVAAKTCTISYILVHFLNGNKIG